MKVALTGGASGIGAAVAARFKSEGHEVVAFDFVKPAGQVDKWIETDLSDQRSIAAAIDAARSEGPYDALINNAGLPPREGEAARVLSVNFMGFRMFLNGMMDQLNSGASIVNTASRAGAMWRDNLEQVKRLLALQSDQQLEDFIKSEEIDYIRAYNLSKEAVIVLTLAETQNLLAKNLRMNSVSPAAVSTGILDEFVSAFGERVEKNIQRVGRAGTAEEVADLIVYLAKPASHWLKGIDVVIDGGMSALMQADVLKLN